MRKCFLLFLIFIISTGIVFATNWMPVVDKWDIDLDSIQWKENNQLIDIWLRNNVMEENEEFEGKKVEYIYYHELLNPTAKIFVTLTEILYGQKGKTLHTTHSPYAGQVKDIPPSSFYNYLTDKFQYVTPKRIEEYQLFNLKSPNFIYFGDTIESRNNDLVNTHPLKNVKEPLVSTPEHKYKEADYINAYCGGQKEFVLKSKSRVDCLTDEYAIEFEFAHKWKEAVGQSLYYAKQTGKRPAIAIIMSSFKDEIYVNKIIEADENIEIFRIPAFK